MAYSNGHTDRKMRIGDVYMARFDGTGSEQSGLRPAVVFQNNKGNAYSPNVIVLPMTTSLKKVDLPTHVVIRARDTGLRFDSMVLCENPECISKDKLGTYITTLPLPYMKKIAAASLVATAAIALLDMDALQSVWEKASELNACA